MGNAWRFPIPSEFRQAILTHKKSLEFVASFLSVWIAIENKYVVREICVLALDDNSSAIGWLHKANVDESKKLTHAYSCS